jgi:hypothetical protein
MMLVQKQKNILSFVLTLLASAYVFADVPLQTTTSTSTTSTTSGPAVSTTITSIQKIEAEKEKQFTLTTAIEYSQKIAVDERSERERGTDINLSATYKINSLYTVLTKASITKDLMGPQDTTFSDTTLGAAVKGVQINPTLITTHSVSAILPTSDVSQKRDRLRTAMGLSNGISYSNDYIQAKYNLAISKNFHEFSQNAEGTMLSEYKITNSVDLIVPVTDKFSVSATGLYRTSFTYDKDQKYGFGFYGDLNYDFTQKLSANIGISTEGSALKSNGVDSNISVYDDNSSVTRAGITYVY